MADASFPPVDPVRRDLRFPLTAADLKDWHAAGPEVSHYINALSVFFPVGERFFIHTLRNYRDDITDPRIRRHVTAFIGQEAMHGREHDVLNRALDELGMPAAKLERGIDALLEWIKARAPRSAQLSITMGLEHYTALLGDQLLRHDDVLAGAGPALGALWHWHALEEVEHKGVAHDVWSAAVHGRELSPAAAYAVRTVGFTVASSLFFYYTIQFQRYMMRAAGYRAGFRGWLRFLNFAFGARPGVLRRMLPAMLSYYRPGFHPWQHDNRDLLAGLAGLENHYGVVPQAGESMRRARAPGESRPSDAVRAAG